jgi:hypothetical protein
MPLKKSILEIPIADGLKQVFDPRSLPPGSSATALNMWKDKSGRLVKRLGLFPLAATDPLRDSYELNTGIALATWAPSNGQPNLLVVGRGEWASTSATVTSLQSQSDDLGGMVIRGRMPDVKITGDVLLSNASQPATNMCSASSGDFIVFAWIQAAETTISPQVGSIWWCAIERSTGNFIIPPISGVPTAQTAQYLRLIVVGTTFVIAWCDGNVTPGHILGATMTAHALSEGQGWTLVSGGIVTTNIAQYAYGSTKNLFDMRAVQGDPLNFVVAYAKTGGGEAYTANIVVDQYPVAAIVTDTPTARWVVATELTEPVAFGVRADANATNCVVLSYAIWSSISGYQIKAAIGNYPAMTGLRTTTQGYTSGTSGIEQYAPPAWLDVIYGGNGGQTGNVDTWTVSWSPYMSVWNGWAQILQSTPGGQSAGSPSINSGRVVANGTTVDATGDARIISAQFFLGSGTTTVWAADTSGTSSIETPGVVLASRGIEANGIAYYLGWIPSWTQGSFLVLALDLAQNPEVGNGAESPMRPVGILQTRTALAEPGVAINSSMGPQSIIGVTPPNQWTGGSEWCLSGDNYGTANVAYVGSSQGQRLQPAYGSIQLQPTTGYPYATWGTMTLFGGGLCMSYAGQNAVEQGFLYGPESIVVVMGALGKASGPSWSNTTDSVTWIFTWEWFDEQGNFHQSARSTPVTITGQDLVNAGVATISGGTLLSGAPLT